MSGWDHDNDKPRSNWKKLAGNLELLDFARTNVIILNYSFNKISSLKIVDGHKLTWLIFNKNKISKINLTYLPNLTNFDFSDNYLEDLEFLSSLNPDKLTNLIINNNNLVKQDISIFNRFVNLDTLRIDNTDKEKFETGIHNRFFGSLRSLKDLTKLRVLGIANNEIDFELEDLPISLELINYFYDLGFFWNRCWK
ncbi:MAG: hypothetical protein mread185_000127 [Mycoplasmataceae bacterium]|nr:MAG: hypothetical protein mread185_000127 [Mycoplasmataceae bacterium]